MLFVHVTLVCFTGLSITCDCCLTFDLDLDFRNRYGFFSPCKLQAQHTAEIDKMRTGNGRTAQKAHR